MTSRSSRNRPARSTRPRLEALEDRLAPATLLALTSNNSLLRFDSATPGTLASTTAITGLNTGENVLGIDYRPANGQLYAVTTANRLLTINATTGAATLVATLTADPTDTTNPFTALTGNSFGVDFNPVPDRLRVVSDADQNLRINPDTGTVITDGTLAYAAGDPNAAADPNIVAVAYQNNFAGTGTTTLFDLDSNLDILTSQNPPNNGTLNTIGSLAQALLSASGFDIQTTTTGAGNTVNNIAFAIADDANGDTNLATVNLTTGVATLVGDISGDPTVLGLAVVPAGTLNFQVTSLRVNEQGNAVATVTVTRTGGSLGAVSATVSTTANGTATPGVDFTATTAVVNFADGVTTAQTVNIPIIDDQQFEGVETIEVSLNTATGDAVIGANSTAIIAIGDNELPRTTLFGVNVVNNVTQIVEFDSTTPGTIKRTTAVLGLSTGESLVGIDFRPANGQLFGLVVNGTNARLVIINIVTGGTTQVGPAFTVSGTDFGFDFNPTNDRIRITSDADINLLVDPNTGAVTTQTNLNPGTPNVVASAYNNNFAGANVTTLYAIDSATDQLFTQVPAAGTLTLVGNLGFDTGGLVGFDISGLGDQAFASLTGASATSSQLRSIDLSTGDASLIGTIGGGATIRALSSLTANTINLSANQRFVTQLFLDALGRGIDAGGLQFFSAALDAGTMSKAQVATFVLNSTEFRTGFIQSEFQRLLGRSADTGGLNAFLNLLASGASPAQVTAAIIGSQEYFTRAGGTNTAFVTQAFQDVLGRAPDTGGLTAFTNALNSGALTRQGVANALLNSDEGLARQINAAYTRYLGRTADAGGLAAFTNLLRQPGQSINNVIAILVSSAEYQSLVG